MKDIKFYPKICWGIAISVTVLGLGAFLWSQSNNDTIEGGCFEGPGASPPKSMKRDCCTQTNNRPKCCVEKNCCTETECCPDKAKCCPGSDCCSKPTPDCKCDSCKCDPCECGSMSNDKSGLTSDCKCDSCECDPCEC